MGIDELEKILAEEKKTPDPALEPKAPDEPNKDDELKKKEEALANIQKAIKEANDQLRSTRKAIKENKPPEEETLPKIDLEDPNSRAWDKHVSSKIDPLNDELAKEKEEVRTFALQEFLKDKPNLAASPDKLKRVMTTYEKIRTASERTLEGVLLDLKKAYAAEFHDEIVNDQVKERIAEAQSDAIFSDPAVSRGATSYPTERQKAPHLNSDDAVILAKWGLTPSEWVKMKQEQDKKKT